MKKMKKMIAAILAIVLCVSLIPNDKKAVMTDEESISAEVTGLYGSDSQEKDSDNDGISNSKELQMGTDLEKADSDKDNISDYDEINRYQTDPAKYDSDDDGLCDGDEILLGLNPLDQMTDGEILDGERIFE